MQNRHFRIVVWALAMTITALNGGCLLPIPQGIVYRDAGLIGRAVDAETHQAVSDASVQMIGPLRLDEADRLRKDDWTRSRSCLTANGAFDLKPDKRIWWVSIPPADPALPGNETYLLLISADGYEPWSKTFFNHAAFYNEPKQIDVGTAELKPLKSPAVPSSQAN